MDQTMAKTVKKSKNWFKRENQRYVFIEDNNEESFRDLPQFFQRNKKEEAEITKLKIFNLQQIKKQLVSIEMKCQQSQLPLKMNYEQNNRNFLSLEKRKTPIAIKDTEISKRQSTVLIQSEDITNEQLNGFTQRITSLIKTREQHDKIINDLVKKKASRLSINHQNLFESRKKSEQLKVNPVAVQQSKLIQKELFETEKAYSRYHKPFKKSSLQLSHQILQQRHLSLVKSSTVGNYKLKDEMSSNKQLYQSKADQKIVEKKYFVQTDLQKQKKLVAPKQITQKIQSRYFQQYQIESLSERESKQNLNQSVFQLQDHVNLISTLLQFNNQLSDQSSKFNEQNQLYPSLIKFLDKFLEKQFCISKPQIVIKYIFIDPSYSDFYQILNKAEKIKGFNPDLIKLAQYLSENQIWEGLFRSELSKDLKLSQNHYQSEARVIDYFGLCFDCGNYIETFLSHNKLEEEEKKLLIFKVTNLNSFVCDISFLLLSRIIDTDTNKTFPAMLHRLFGYQFKIFSIQKTVNLIQILSYIDRLKQICNQKVHSQGSLALKKANHHLKQKYSHERIESNKVQNFSLKTFGAVQKQFSFELFGRNKISQSFELIKPVFSQQKSMPKESINLYEFRQLIHDLKYLKKITQNYDCLSIINQKQLPVKHIELKHFENHFIVISLNVAQEGLYFLSAGKRNGLNLLNKAKRKQNQDCYPETNKVQKEKNFLLKNRLYRVCLIQTKTRKVLECFVLTENQAYPVYLMKLQFEVYLSAYEKHPNQQQLKQQTPSTVLNFIFYVQSKHLKTKQNLNCFEKLEPKELKFELRLKEEYKNYTSVIVQQLIQSYCLYQKITRFFICFGFFNLDNKIKQQKIESQFQIKIFKNSENYRNAKQIFSFEEMLNEDRNKVCINVLRVHLKMLDLYIDCINTKVLVAGNQQSRDEVTLKLKYKFSRVLCDQNHQKNIIQIPLNAINFVYLTKDSPIECITKSHQKNQINCQQIYQKLSFQHKIFEFSW